MNRVPGEIYVGEIAQPQETHAACIFLLDTSDSMNYPSIKINSLNEAVRIFKEQACRDRTTGNVIDVAVIEFGGEKARVVSEFTPVSKFNPPTLKGHGCTPMGNALELGIEMAKRRVRQYKLEGTDAHIPWLVMITDGANTDSLTKAKQMLEEERKKGKYGHIKLWIVAVDGAKLSVCQSLTQRILFVKDKDYRKIFKWTADSMVKLSDSKPGDAITVDKVPDNVQVVLPGVIPEGWLNL